MPLLQYLGNFQGYKAIRSPFYDLFSAIFYLPTAPFLGVRATTIFSLLVGCVSVPALFILVNRSYGEYPAILSTLLYAFYPKLLVLTGQGYPEAVSTGIVILTVLSMTKASGKLHGTVTGGILATLAYLIYIPAVVFGVWTGVYLVSWRVRQIILSGRIIQREFRDVLKFGVIPIATGFLYLLFGPVTRVIANSSGQGGNAAKPLFIHPESYGLGEKVIRYLLYNYFDFWWHLRGFDKEFHVLRAIDKVQSFLGPGSDVFLLGWVGLTTILSILILIGTWKMITRRGHNDQFYLGWITVYVIVDTFMNLGWVGAFQFRHIFPVFPAICVAFGIGGSVVMNGRLGQMFSRHTPLNNFKFRNKRLDIFQITVILLLLSLVAVGFVNGYFAAENNRHSMKEPTDRMLNEIDPSDTVVVTNDANYQWTVLYSEGQVWPLIWVGTNEQLKSAKSRTVIADIRIVEPENLPNREIDYIYMLQPCGDLSAHQLKIRQTILDRGGREIFRLSEERGSKCDVTASLIDSS